MQVNSRSLTAADICQLVGESPVMLEVGCNDGTDTLRFVKAMPGIRLFCFEPDPRPAAVWRQRVSCKRACLIEKAVSDVDGEAVLYQSGGRPDPSGVGEWNKSSSIVEPTGHYKMSPWCTFTPGGSVPTIRLDTWLAQHNFPDIDFIWADTQGSEGKLIAGGLETLKRTRYLYTEFYNTPMYAGQPSLPDICKMLRGWEPMALYGTDNCLLRNTTL